MKEYRADHFKKNYIHRVTPFPKVRELFELIKGKGKKIAIGSSAHEEELDVYLKLVNVTDLVDMKTSADDAERAKPHPDIFQVILVKLNSTPSETMVIGDSPYDAEAAGKAQIKTIGFLCGGFAKETLTDAGAIALFDGPDDLLENYNKSPLK